MKSSANPKKKIRTVLTSRLLQSLLEPQLPPLSVSLSLSPSINQSPFGKKSEKEENKENFSCHPPVREEGIQEEGGKARTNSVSEGETGGIICGGPTKLGEDPSEGKGARGEYWTSDTSYSV